MTSPPVSQAVILAGGLGTRLGKLTQQQPKPLLPVGSGAFMDILVNELARQGVTDVIISAGFLGEKLQSHYLTWRPRAGLSCAVRVEVEPEPLGTAGALRYLYDMLDDRFLVLNGDSWFDLDLVDFCQRPLRGRFSARLALRNVYDVARFGSVELEGERILAFREKGPTGPGLINAGVYLFDRSALEPPVDGFWSLEQGLLPRLATQGRLSGQAYEGYFLDIGTPESFAKAQHEIPDRLRKPVLVLSGRDLALLLHHPSALREIRFKRYYLFLADPDGELPDRELLNDRLSAIGGFCDRILTGTDFTDREHASPENPYFGDWDGLREGSLMISSSIEDADLARRLGVPFRPTAVGMLGDAVQRLPNAEP